MKQARLCVNTHGDRSGFGDPKYRLISGCVVQCRTGPESLVNVYLAAATSQLESDGVNNKTCKKEIGWLV